jgi:ribosome-associated toxin RatA of RatAB toxin-antitoxin module
VPVITGSSSAVLDAAIGRCWKVVEDVASAPEWQGGLLELEVIERDEQGRPLVCDTLSDAKLRKSRTRQRFTYAAPTRLSWEMLEGDLDSMEGYWELEDLGDDHTRVTYGLAVDPGPIPRLARGPFERVARAILVAPRANELARRVTGG